MATNAFGANAQTNAQANANPAGAPVSATAQTSTVPSQPIVVTQVVVRVVQPPVDPAKAKAAKEEAVRKTVEFQKRRADEGSESAQYELGLRYLKGDGVEKDEAAGRKWLELASKNGYGPATKKLDDLNKQGPPANEEK
jgi:TPR repeat protein